MLKFFEKLFGRKVENNVLVGIVKDSVQYKANIENNFYHIPAKRIYTLDLPIKYVALFRSDRIFPEDESGIYVYGKVKKHSYVKRHQISEIPKESDEEYLRLDVEKWMYLPSPIRSGEIYKTHIFTTLSILKTAKSVPELFMPDNEAIKFYRFLERECSKIPDIQIKGCTYNGIKVAFTKEYIEVVYPNTFHTKLNRASYCKKPYALYLKILNG